MLHLSSVCYRDTLFAHFERWDASLWPADLFGQLTVCEIAVSPPGKHDLRLCEQYEKLWRHWAPVVISAIRPRHRACFVWASGPMQWRELTQVFPYIVSWAGVSRYHVEATTFTHRTGYVHSWVSFEFRKETFVDLMADDQVDLEYTKLQLLIFPEECVEAVITRPFWAIGLEWILEHDAVALVPLSHFEGTYILGKGATLAKALERLKTSLSSRTTIKEHFPEGAP